MKQIYVESEIRQGYQEYDISWQNTTPYAGPKLVWTIVMTTQSGNAFRSGLLWPLQECYHPYNVTSTEQILLLCELAVLSYHYGSKVV